MLHPLMNQKSTFLILCVDSSLLPLIKLNLSSLVQFDSFLEGMYPAVDTNIVISNQIVW